MARGGRGRRGVIFYNIEEKKTNNRQGPVVRSPFSLNGVWSNLDHTLIHLVNNLTHI